MKEICMQAGRSAKKVASKTLRKRCSIPLWLMLVLIGIPAFCKRFPGPQQPVTELVAQASAPMPLEAIPSELGPIAGIDVSMWQGTIDWEAVKESGVEFVIIKATEGTAYVDPTFITNWDGAKEAGLLVSAYHMLWPNLSATKQAEHFLNTMGERKADFPLALDVELKGEGGNIGAVVEEIALTVEASDGRVPIIYTAQSIWNTHVGWAPGWHRFSLWVAGYDATTPAMPDGWDSYTFWQHSSTGKVPGISGNVDLNVFVGDRAALMALGR